MDWLILIVLVPAVIVPVVLLFGFSGCAAVLGLDEVTYTGGRPAAPFNLQAAAIGTDTIRLTWQHNSAGGLTFRVQILEPGQSSWREYRSGISLMTVDSTPLAEGTEYHYLVQAVDSAGNRSDPSDPATARTLKWEIAYQKQLAADGGNQARLCLVQRMASTLLQFGGRRVRITVRSATSTPLVISSAHISRAAPAGFDAWDSDSDITPVATSPITVPAGTSFKLPEVDYALSTADDLIIAFDIASGATRSVQSGVGASATYTKANAAEAATRNRSGFTTRAGTVTLVEQIDVLTG